MTHPICFPSFLLTLWPLSGLEGLQPHRPSHTLCRTGEGSCFHQSLQDQQPCPVPTPGPTRPSFVGTHLRHVCGRRCPVTWWLKQLGKVGSCGFSSNSKRRSKGWSPPSIPVPCSQSNRRIAIYCAISSTGCGALGDCCALCKAAGKHWVWHFALSSALSCKVSAATAPPFLGPLQGHHYRPQTMAPATSPAQCHRSTLPSECQLVTEGFSLGFEAPCHISTASKLPLCPKPSPQMQIALTLLTRISVASKCRPYILGDSPGIGSILTHTSWPFFATSTGLWFISILVTIPISTNCNTMKQL